MSTFGTVQALLAADDGVTVNFDFGLGYGQRGHGDEGAAREIVAEYFPPELCKAITVAHIAPAMRPQKKTLSSV